MLLRVKRIISEVIVDFYDQSYFKKFRIFLKPYKNTNQELFIFDLDNTLAHTFPQLQQKDKIAMYKTLPIHQNMVALARKTIETGAPSIILTARSYKYKNATKYWLSKTLNQDDIPLFIVSSAREKLNYLKEAKKTFGAITYYDDLSYNHEHGTVKFYKDIIDEVEQMGITYIDYHSINKINSN